MAEQASVSSIEALEAFRASLIRYIEKAKRALEDVSGEVKRTRAWLDTDRRLYWDGQVKLCEKRLAQAEQELYSAQLSPLKESNSFQRMAVLKARRNLAEARERRVVVKKWRQAFDTTVEVRARQLEGINHRVTQELPKAVVFLTEAIKTLQAYADSKPSPRRRTGGDPAAGATGETAAPASPAADAADRREGGGA